MKTEQKIMNKIEKESKALAFSRFSENLARIGYGARGLIYATIGFLALRVALGVSGSLEDTQGAISIIGKQPLGKILLGVILIGLIGYSLWGLIRAFLDPLHKGKDFKGILKRIGFFISAVAYAILIPATYGFIFNSNTIQTNTESVELGNIISTIFLIPFGKYIVILIGLFILASGLLELYKGLRHNFDKQIKVYDLNPKQTKVIKMLGRFGALARAVVVAIIGVFLIFSSYNSSSTKIKGIDGALLILLQQPYGSWLLGAVALGLISFGAYSLLSGFWFKFKKSHI